MSPEGQSKLAAAAKVARAFTPSAPVGSMDLFAGRTALVMGCVEALFEAGRHIAVYGERGVGKTSLAKVLPQIVHQPEQKLIGVRIDCSTDDDFGTIWKRVFREMGEPPPTADDLTPDGIRYRLQLMGGTRLIALDEFDRIANDDALTLLADTVKALSDSAIDVTIMLVGVAESIDYLVGEHASVARALNQVFMPRMSPGELDGILSQRLPLAELEMEPEARALVVRLAQGLPTYVHLLAMHAGQRCVADDRSRITLGDTHAAIKKATETHTMMSGYKTAIHSNQSTNLFRHVLLACAFAAQDHGEFRASDVVQPLGVLLGKPVQLQTFSWHLKELVSPERGVVLQKSGRPRRSRYRFRDPLLQPFIKLAALGDGTISQRTMEELEQRFPAAQVGGSDDWPNELRPLVEPLTDVPPG